MKQSPAVKRAQRIGIDLAQATKATAYRGRKPSFTRRQLARVLSLTARGSTVAEIAHLPTLSRQTVYRIQANPAAQEAALRTWRL